MGLTTTGSGRTEKKVSKWKISPEDIHNHSDPYAAIGSGKIMAKAWAKTLNESDHTTQAQTFVLKVIESYWQKIHNDDPRPRPLPFLFKKVLIRKLDKSVTGVAEAIGAAAASLPVIEASYLLGNVYTAVLPESARSSGGIFYTPPALTARLIRMAEEAGVNWATARIIDPACGGGAFLAPVSLKIKSALNKKKPKDILSHICSHLSGWEIDPFGGWLTQVFVEVALKDLIRKAGIKMPPIVNICNSLEKDVATITQFDLVIGNPPYGKLKLTDTIRSNFRESLYGHPNLYGLFTHQALKLAREQGVVAFLTPTSFLSGEYFKNLRLLLGERSAPLEMDFVAVRKGVFEDVLQETMLATYKKGAKSNRLLKVNQLTTLPGEAMHLEIAGSFSLPKDLSQPWILPRTPQQARPVKAMKKMSYRLADWGYQVSTGPLVWNRHKPQLGQKSGAGYFPVIWAESVTQNGQFILKAEKVNHHPYFKFLKGDEWLVTTAPCILLQRTTAKEQEKRLVAAALPMDLWIRGVVIENHLNMIIAIDGKPKVPANVLAAFLNSRAVNDAFRTISGSVAVSAYELESFPLPAAEKLHALTALLSNITDQPLIEEACQQLYNYIS